MPLFAFEGRRPQVHPEAWVAPTATLIGDVVVEEGASVWYGVVCRADFGRIVIRAGANVQDNSVLHGGEDPATEIGPGATVGHVCVVHGAVVGAEALIGNGSTVLDGAVIGRRSLIGGGSLVPPGAVIPDEVMALGSPARVRGPLSEVAAGWVDGNPGIYRELARRHAAGIVPVAAGADGDVLHSETIAES
jgi:carbonic anhydrase/acetyltransferase-like protein (isoleucine patch superfamily)